MNIERNNMNQNKLPVKARIGRGRPVAARIGRINPAQRMKVQLRVTRVMERGKGGIKLQRKNIITKSGKVLSINRNISVQKNIKNGNKAIGRKVLETKNFINIRRNNNNLGNKNLSLSRKVEFGNRNVVLEEDGEQDIIPENIEFGFQNIPNIPNKIPLLPTPPMEEQIFPNTNFESNSSNFMGMTVKNSRDFDLQSIHSCEEDLRAIEREQVEDLMYQEEQKRFEEEQRRIEEERHNLDDLRRTLDKERRELEMLKKTVEEEEEEEEEEERERSTSLGREKSANISSSRGFNEQLGEGSFIDNRKKKNNRKSNENAGYSGNRNINRGGGGKKTQNFNSRGKGNNNFGHNKQSNYSRYDKGDSPPMSHRIPAAGLLDFLLDKNKNVGGGGGEKSNKMEFEQNYFKPSQVSKRGYNERNASPVSHRMPAAGLMDYMLNKNSREDFSYNDRGNNFSQNDFGDTLKRREYNFSDGASNSDYALQRGFPRNEFSANRESNYNNTGRGYEVLSRGVKSSQDDLQYNKNNEYQNSNAFGTAQGSFAGHPYYDNFYDQGRSDKNQGMWKTASFLTGFNNNEMPKAFPFNQRSQGSGKGSSSDHITVGYQSASQRNVDSFNRYRAGNKGSNSRYDNRKNQEYGRSSQKETTNSSFQNFSSMNLGSRYTYGNAYYSGESSNIFDSSKKTPKKMDAMGSDTPDKNTEKSNILKRKKNIMRELKQLPSWQTIKKKTLERRLADIDEQLSKLH